jgi:hypothetical protein
MSLLNTIFNINNFIIFSIYLIGQCGLSWAQKNPIPMENDSTFQRTLSIIATPDDFFPSIITAFKGERIKIFLTNTDKASHCFTIKEFNIYLGLSQNKIQSVEMELNESGQFHYYCQGTNSRGILYVLNRDGSPLDKRAGGTKKSTSPIEAHELKPTISKEKKIPLWDQIKSDPQEDWVPKEF